MASLKPDIDKALNKYLPSEESEPKALHRAMRYSVFSGGKRIRPIFVIESCRACGGDIRDALPVAAAVEFVHTYSLIHDDLPSMDDDDYRRGKLTCHKAFGEATAVLAGDALLTLAFGVIARHADPKYAPKMISELAGAIGASGMVGGQAIDLELAGKKKSGAVLNLINNLKTAKLFEVSARLGAMAAGSEGGKIKALSKFGLAFGSAFQIVDDILDHGSYVRVFGLRRAHSDAEKMVERARRSIDILGKPAWRLKEIAAHLLNRIE